MVKRVVEVPSSTEILEAWEKIENNLRERFNAVGGNYNPISSFQIMKDEMMKLTGIPKNRLK